MIYLQVESALQSQMTDELHQHYVTGSATAQAFDKLQEEVSSSQLITVSAVLLMQCLFSDLKPRLLYKVGSQRLCFARLCPCFRPSSVRGLSQYVRHYMFLANFHDIQYPLMHFCHTFVIGASLHLDTNTK